MSLISVSAQQPTDGKTPIAAADVNNQVNTIVTEFNGSITSDNIAAGGVALSNLSSTIQLTLADGWTPCAETWTYASATTINVPAGAASKYSVGDKIKLTQTTVKYFYIVTVADTLLTVTGGSDYTVANATISNNYYSKSSSPVGFPNWFNFAPGRAVSGGTAPTYTAEDVSKFTMNGREVSWRIVWYNSTGGTAGSGTNSLTWNLPVATSLYSTSGITGHIGSGMSYENGGTICGVNVQPVTTSTAIFSNVNSWAAIQGADQSADTRIVTASGKYEI
jgi:hypothetical protein